MCIYNDAQQEKDKYQCDGIASAKLSAYIGLSVDDEVEFEASRNFGAEDYSDAAVIACCDNDYLSGCLAGEKPSPQGTLCVQDCAQQACLKITAEALAFVNTLPMVSQAWKQAIEIVSYLNEHTNDCRDAILNGNLCEELHPGNCDHPYAKFGVYELPDMADWPDFEDVRIEVECEINNWHLDPDNGPADACKGVQSNNNDPFPDPLTEDPLIEYEADPISGTFSTLVGTTFVFKAFSGSNIRFRQAPSCTATECAFRLDEMNLAISNLELGDVDLVGIQAVLLTASDGSISGSTVIFEEGAVKLSVSGRVASSTYPAIDDQSFSWIVVNSAPLTLTVTTPTSATPTFTFSAGMFNVGEQFDPSAPTEFYLFSSSGAAYEPAS